MLLAVSSLSVKKIEDASDTVQGEIPCIVCKKKSAVIHNKTYYCGSCLCKHLGIYENNTNDTSSV
tara:strand:- start:49 stop:243 length:195 start_codon:yes stop_codon:yes gene_type:complete